jgi:hypothetical protein
LKKIEKKLNFGSACVILGRIKNLALVGLSRQLIKFELRQYSAEIKNLSFLCQRNASLKLKPCLRSS